MVNLMFDHINRFKDDPRAILSAQIRDFFGSTEENDYRPGMDERELLRFYRQQLKKACGLEFALDLAIRHPVHDRTKLRLVVGGNNFEVVRLFRNVERQVLGGEAREVHAAAKERSKAARTGQPSLPGLEHPGGHLAYRQRDKSVSMRCGSVFYGCWKDIPSTGTFGQGFSSTATSQRRS